MKKGLTLPVLASELIPHQPPIRLVDRIIEYKSNWGVVETVIKPDSFLLDDNGEFDSTAMIELMAQSIAVIKGYENTLDDKPMQNGFLVGGRNVQCMGTVFSGDLLRISIGKVGGIEGFTVADGEIKRDNEIIASGRIKLWVTDQVMKKHTD